MLSPLLPYFSSAPVAPQVASPSQSNTACDTRPEASSEGEAVPVSDLCCFDATQPVPMPDAEQYGSSAVYRCYQASTKESLDTLIADGVVFAGDRS